MASTTTSPTTPHTAFQPPPLLLAAFSFLLSYLESLADSKQGGACSSSSSDGSRQRWKYHIMTFRGGSKTWGEPMRRSEAELWEGSIIRILISKRLLTHAHAPTLDQTPLTTTPTIRHEQAKQKQDATSFLEKPNLPTPEQSCKPRNYYIR